MTNDLQSLTHDFELHTKSFLVKLLKLDTDIDLQVDGNLIEQIGLDSIEAFDAIATLHDLLDVSIPDNFNPKVSASIRDLTAYIINTFGAETAGKFLALDLDKATEFADAGDL